MSLCVCVCVCISLSVCVFLCVCDLFDVVVVVVVVGGFVHFTDGEHIWGFVWFTFQEWLCDYHMCNDAGVARVVKYYGALMTAAGLDKQAEKKLGKAIVDSATFNYAKRIKGEWSGVE